MSNEQNIDETKKENQDENQEKTSRDEFENDLEMLENKNREYLEGWQRAKADYSNLKRESEKKYQDLIKFANVGLIIEVLPVLDNFKLAIRHISEEQQKLDWVVGIMHIKKQLEDILKNLGIEEIKTIGEKFNPELHEAVSAGIDTNQRELEHESTQIDSLADAKAMAGKEGVIVKELRAGYTMHGKVVQVAKVVVGN